MVVPRAERRRRTEGRILDAARSLFAELGYERATIRGVAKRAEVDPALVMQYFGSKQELFQQSVRMAPPAGGELGPEGAVEHVLGSLTMKLGELPQSSLAMMRSMLTHPEAAASARQVLGKQIDRLAEALPGEDARLRAALMTLVMLGITVGHQLLEIDELRGVPQEELARLLRPSLRALTGQEVS
ncbi:TetR/AcrR family transcriptional regulator [Nonomuraea gerenzanensis]|uniref:Transcriptional regulator, TetR family n=1 Tax=Nonomuraea gerenzanensis TaxID=93944 RepID=A0A1M4DZP1_9ACTN|nr:TetR/AcrR family transcriptional regulator [Nonomuraea gerenzanensis]UBU14318.1 TetR family transcriptional regulator [Nonomuraea gerenzanensis]SBO92021.1 Transcriptional regulator, TetR family [Nonomuraea gerenzanensis]